MKIIKKNSIKSIAVSSADPEYPAGNLLDESPKKKWKAANNSVSSVSITIETMGKTGALAIVGIQADAAYINIEDPNGIIWENVIWNNVVFAIVSGAVETSQTWENMGADYSSLWIDFEQFDAAVAIEIVITKNYLNPYALSAGVLMVGLPFSFPNPQYGFSEGLKDYSLLRELSNGAVYYKKRDIVKTFSGKFSMDRLQTVIPFLRDIARFYGLRPMMLRFVDDFSGEWVVYGRLENFPVASHGYFSRSDVDISFIEVL